MDALTFEYSEDLKSRIQQYLTKKGFEFEFDKEMGVFRMPFGVGGLCKALQYHIVIYKTEYMVSVQSRFHANPDNGLIFSEVAKLLCLINYNIKTGSLSMDSRGDIRFRYTVECTNCPPSKEVIERSILSAGWCFRHYENAFYYILTGEMTTKQAEKELDIFCLR